MNLTSGLEQWDPYSLWGVASFGLLLGGTLLVTVVSCPAALGRGRFAYGAARWEGVPRFACGWGGRLRLRPATPSAAHGAALFLPHIFPPICPESLALPSVSEAVSTQRSVPICRACTPSARGCCSCPASASAQSATAAAAAAWAAARSAAACWAVGSSERSKQVLWVARRMPQCSLQQRQRRCSAAAAALAQPLLLDFSQRRFGGARPSAPHLRSLHAYPLHCYTCERHARCSTEGCSKFDVQENG